MLERRMSVRCRSPPARAKEATLMDIITPTTIPTKLPWTQPIASYHQANRPRWKPQVQPLSMGLSMHCLLRVLHRERNQQMALLANAMTTATRTHTTRALTTLTRTTMLPRPPPGLQAWRHMAWRGSRPLVLTSSWAMDAPVHLVTLGCPAVLTSSKMTKATLGRTVVEVVGSASWTLAISVAARHTILSLLQQIIWRLRASKVC
mmetsp:Transcript_15857/g.40866  ORF Transcript_15857/g.40866 Transcript_15857/m.40866 type:complete len:205 (-) Transcript_15857:312-926(-)